MAEKYSFNNNKQSEVQKKSKIIIIKADFWPSLSTKRAAWSFFSAKECGILTEASDNHKNQSGKNTDKQNGAQGTGLFFAGVSGKKI